MLEIPQAEKQILYFFSDPPKSKQIAYPVVLNISDKYS
jgi:hypothetical protein